jgi:hypothetical protein
VAACRDGVVSCGRHGREEEEVRAAQDEAATVSLHLATAVGLPAALPRHHRRRPPPHHHLASTPPRALPGRLVLGSRLARDPAARTP